ncbi:MAG: hypothetical protein WCY05_05180 [Candidatus Omnitrophota bacterium]
MFKFRGQRVDNKEWVEGYHVFDKFENKHYMQIPVSDKDFDSYFEITPNTLSISTGQFDKNKIEIFGSIPLEDGAMSNGGDKLQCVSQNEFSKGDISTRNVIYSGSSFHIEGTYMGLSEFLNYGKCTIIGKQCDEAQK